MHRVVDLRDARLLADARRFRGLHGAPPPRVYQARSMQQAFEHRHQPRVASGIVARARDFFLRRTSEAPPGGEGAAAEGWVDLHCHFIPGVDDGVRSIDDARSLLSGLRSLGFAVVVATPHMRAGMFENEPSELRAAFAQCDSALNALDLQLPARRLAAEHHVDDWTWSRLPSLDVLAYPSGDAMLVEFPDDRLPVAVETRMFELRLKGIRPVVAHPERCRPLRENRAQRDALLHGGCLFLLDLMSLVGHYGGAAKAAARTMLEEEAYFAACSDTHRPSQLATLEQSLRVLERLVGKETRRRLLSEHPRTLLGRHDQAAFT